MLVRFSVFVCLVCSCGDNLHLIDVEHESYVKPLNPRAELDFGRKVAASADGQVLVVAAEREPSESTGIGIPRLDSSAPNSGAVYVYVRSGPTWFGYSYIKSSNSRPDAYFGRSLALSADGTTLAVGAVGDSSSARGIDGDQDDENAPSSGAVYVFRRSGTEWRQMAYIKSSNSDAEDAFGVSVALSESGLRLAVGASGERSASSGVNGNQDDETAPGSGAVYVFDMTDETWSQTAYIKASNPSERSMFGWDVGLSADGETLVVGALLEGDNETSAPASGAAYVFSFDDGTWFQKAYLKASNAEAADIFGFKVGISGDGATIAIGATGESSADNGINADEGNNDATASGATYVFIRTGDSWLQESYIKASNSNYGDSFGAALELSYDGSSLVVGAPNEGSLTHEPAGDQTSNYGVSVGAVYRFERVAGEWQQESFIKAFNAEPRDAFGVSVSLAENARTLVVGASGEASNATGVDGDDKNNDMPGCGAAYVFVE
jgi:trimeric autotransporter adhesin